MRLIRAASGILLIAAVLNQFDRLNTAIVVKAHPELSGKAIQEAQDILIKQPEILNHLPRVAGLLVRQALSVGYAEAMGYAMLVAGLFAFVGCLVAFSVSTDSNLH
jgi:cation transporter-like permease